MKSLWQTEADIKNFPALYGDKSTDVLIIGGGMAGILTAYFLHKKGVKYILVESGRLCFGTTKNTTAKITCQHGLIYQDILKSYGTEYAQKYLTVNQLACEQFARMCEKIDCYYEIKDNYVYSVNNRTKLENEMNALNRIGYKADFVEHPAIPLKTSGTVRFPEQAQFNSLKFIASISKNLNIYENTRVVEMIDNTAVTENGSIRAKQVVVATHFPFINKHGSYFIKLYQHRSYILALENACNVNGMYVDESKTGFSFRNYKDYLLLGGGAHRTGKHGGNWTELREFAEKAFPDAKEKYSWAAQDCMTLDKIPYIGKYSKSTEDLYVETGFNKWGMSSAMVSSMIITDLILGKRNEYAKVFNPSRNILKPQLLINTMEATKNILTPTTKRCPHLGCALKWNKTEHSWDCPCHGSRFSENGKLLENPANTDMKVKDK